MPFFRRLSPTVFGILLMCAAVTLFAVLDATVKWLGQSFSAVQVVWFRYVTHVLLAVIVLGVRTPPRDFLPRRLGPQMLRGVFLLTTTLFNFAALVYLQLTETMTIHFLAPLLIALLSIPLLGERIGPRRWGAIIVGFIGIVIAVRPGFGDVHWAVLLSLCSVFTYALYAIMTRQLASTETSESLLVVSAVVPVVGLLPVLPFIWIWPSDLLTWTLIVATGAFGGWGHFLLIRAHAHAPAPIIAPFVYTQFISMLVLGYVIFGDVPTAWTVAGAVIVVLSGLYLLFRERQIKLLPASPHGTALAADSERKDDAR